MGYSTKFDGYFELDHPLMAEHKAYLLAFAETRRMRRNAQVTATRPDPVRTAVGLVVGPEGAYFVGETGQFGQDRSPDIIDYNAPPVGQPGLWCQWVPNHDGSAIEWNGAEKFYDYVEWLEYLIVNFLEPWGYTLNGEVEWQGEEGDDFGKILVKHNNVKIKIGRKVFDE